MALIPVTFKHPKDATEEKQKKTGKVSSITARMLYANTFSGKVGIVKGYKKDDATDELSVSYDSSASTSTQFRLVFNKGAVSIYGGIGIIEQGTYLDINKGLTNYSVGIKVDLTKGAGQEMDWFVKSPSETLRKDDLQIRDNDGVYEFELFKITTTATTPTVTDKTTQYIQSVEEYVENRLSSLNFREGSIEGFVSSDTVPINKLTRQGHYVFGNLVIEKFNGQNYSMCKSGVGIENTKQIKLGFIPKEFAPLEPVITGCYCKSQSNDATGLTESSIHILINNYKEADTVNSCAVYMILGSVSTNNTSSYTKFYHSADNPMYINFGYETEPIPKT